MKLEFLLTLDAILRKGNMPIEMLRSVGWNTIGPFWPMTCKPSDVTSWPWLLICSAPLRV